MRSLPPVRKPRPCLVFGDKDLELRDTKFVKTEVGSYGEGVRGNSSRV